MLKKLQEMKGSTKIVMAVVGAVLFGLGWAAFRPETLFTESRVDEALPASVVTSGDGEGALLTGSFEGMAHHTEGKAEVFSTEDGKGILRFSDFETSNGPDLVVTIYREGSAERVELGAIKGNVGDQNYEIDDPESVERVSIWCRRFDVDFGSATLN